MNPETKTTPEERPLIKINLPPATALLCALILLGYLLPIAIPLNELALSPALVYERPWTLITHMFMHANIPHLLLNLMALFMFGIILEPHIGTKRFLIIFFLSGLSAGLGEALIASPDSSSVGASGAIFGVMGALAMLKPRSIVLVEFIPVPMIVAAIGYGLSNLLFLKQQDGTAHPAHLFGLLFGIIYGLYMRAKK